MIMVIFHFQLRFCRKDQKPTEFIAIYSEFILTDIDIFSTEMATMVIDLSKMVTFHFQLRCFFRKDDKKLIVD